ncbi:DUF2818 family protein [Massilia oculi]|jgi:hypothetical protein|uniref:DUF2818 domain-containing protein n=1 Tax=Massilia oculi TaxID=945844 RepID=A0A2S2DN19_9BURK|nr:DUF2818 family protein [Massilia oculi]AWL06775.1 DUF2818 domain-containing protein [Massilia oculi]
MDSSLAALLVIALALAGANLPFVNERLFGFVPVPAGNGKATDGEPRNKAFALRLLELVVLYFVVGLVARLLESRIGSVFVQTWEFYAITGCMFLVLAFPGFVMRYMRKRRQV